MKNIKGFTLVEIIIAIVILISIAGISIPIISINEKQKKVKEHNEMIENIKESSGVFIETNNNVAINENYPYYLRLNVLKHTGLIELPLKDPLTGNDITDDVCIEIKKNEIGLLDYNIVTDGTLDCINKGVEITQFELDESVAYIGKGKNISQSKLNDYVLSYDSNDESSVFKIVTDSNIDNNVPGKYTVNYKIKDINNDVESEIKSKTFYVVDLKFEYSNITPTYIKKGTNINLDSYRNYSINPPLSEMGLDESHLSYSKTGSLNINNVGKYNIGYKAILNVGVESEIEEKEFEVVDDQKINITFLTDDKTKHDYNQSTINTWKSNLKSSLDETVSEKGIEYIININKLDTTIIRNGPSYSLENGVGLFPSNTTDLKSVEYLGVFNDQVVVEARYSETVAGSRDTWHRTILADLNTGENQTLYERCTFLDKNNINCYASETDRTSCCIRKSGKTQCMDFSVTENEVYEYKLVNGNYNLNASAQRSYVPPNCNQKDAEEEFAPNEITYNRIKENYSNGSTNWNNHINPTGIAYELKSSQMRDILMSIGFSSKNAKKYSIDDYSNVFMDDNNNKGYLIFKDSQGNVDGYTDAYILWEKYTTTETFLANKTSANSKNYLVLLANNVNNHTQSFNISNYDKVIIFSDNTTKSNIKKSTSISNSFNYISLQNSLSKLNNIIK